MIHGDPCPHCSPEDYMAEVRARWDRAVQTHELEDEPTPRWRDVEWRAKQLTRGLDQNLVRLVIENRENRAA